MIRSLKILVPLGILVVAAGGVALMVVLQPVHEPRPQEVIAPLIRVVRVEAQDVQLVVRAQGTVAPRTESDLIPQVTGEVVWMSPNLVVGGFFEKGEPLVRIDRADYEAARESARANVARAESEYARADKEEARQRRLADRSVASQSRIDDAETALRVAEASLREKRSQLERAARDLARTELTAPYAGRVRHESVDVGQFATRGQPLAKLYAVDYAEVRLPLPDRELAYFDVPLAYRDEREEPALLPEREAGPARPVEELAEVGGPESSAAPRRDDGPEVLLTAEFAGRPHTWIGRVVRTEGEIDPKSRMVTVVARVADPYGRAGELERPPLAVGLFVEAEIRGWVAHDAFVVPRSALRRDAEREGDRVLVVDDDSRLHFRDVEVLRHERERVVIRDGLVDGERVCISPLRAVMDGMRVRVAPVPQSSTEGALAGAPR